MEQTITIEQGNILIGEFDGMELEITDMVKYPKNYHQWKLNLPERSLYYVEYYGAKEDIAKKYLKYHTSYDWLMPVVEKIESLTTTDGRGEVNYIVSIETGIVIISVGGEAPIVEVQYEVENDKKRKAVWEAVVKFIQWYNENKDHGNT